jgi:hydrogenase small subunit
MLGPHFIIANRNAESKISRREFLKFCVLMGGVLGLPANRVQHIANALQNPKRPPVIYLHFQDCAGDTEACFRSFHPTIEEMILGMISLDYSATLMATAGKDAEAAKEATIEAGNYLLIVEGSIPTKDGGIFCCINGRTAIEHLQEAAAGAQVIIAAGNCAISGNLAAATPNPTGAVGVKDIIHNKPIINLAGCPCNAVTLAATLTYFLAYQSLPKLDATGRPLFAYGTRIHDHCERRAYFDTGNYVEHWGDEGHRLGWCLYKMGCKGPETYHNCPAVRYNGGTSWPIGSGHGCVGCGETTFFDTMSPFYKRLPNVQGFGQSFDPNKAVIGLGIATAGLIGIHALGSAIRKRQEVAEVPLDAEEYKEVEEVKELPTVDSTTETNEGKKEPQSNDEGLSLPNPIDSQGTVSEMDSNL